MKKILIVDDMQVSLMIAENILASKYETFTATSGAEAIEIYRRERPDMVLSDLRMPGMTGFELQLALQEEYRAVIPFVFMTADKTEEAEMKGFDNGAMDFVRKPLNPDLLLRRIGNIMQQLESLQVLKQRASIDRLTGLLNKAASEEKLREVCRESRGALMMIDLDSFKLVNDLHGHAMGDDVLLGFADILRAAVRPNDIIGRLGGDEFVVFCYGLLDEAGIAKKAEYINKCLTDYARDLLGAQTNIPLGASVGGVFVPDGGADFAELLQKADKALYVVKQNGKHGYSVYSDASPSAAKAAANPLDHIEMILSERHQEGGALQLPPEGFSSVYRFLRRTLQIYEKPNCILLFTLSGKAGAAISTDAVDEQFFDVLRSTLRKGDAVTRNGKHQFLALLSNTTFPDFSHAVERIQDHWEQNPASGEVVLSYEWSPLEP